MTLFFVLLSISLILFFIFTFIFGKHFELFMLYLFAPFLITLFVSGFVVADCDTVDIVVSDQQIYSLQDNISSSSSGAFTIYFSSDENKYYYYSFDEKTDCLKYGSISAKNVLLKFDDNPRLVKYKTITKNENIRNWFFDLNSKTYTVLYLPKDSIISSINVDLI